MFYGPAIAVAFLVVVFGNYTLPDAGKPPAPWVRQFARVALVASVYLVLSGAYLLNGWRNPFEGHGPVRGPVIALIAVRYWPYALMLIGGMCGFNYARVARTTPEVKRA